MEFSQLNFKSRKQQKKECLESFFIISFIAKIKSFIVFCYIKMTSYCINIFSHFNVIKIMLGKYLTFSVIFSF